MWPEFWSFHPEIINQERRVKMEQTGFRARLTARQEEINSLVCVGLDPLVEKLPDIVRASTPSLWSAVLLWMREIVDATAPHASLFKPQHAHWEAIPGGLNALRALIAHIRFKHPNIPIFLDCKRGDIFRTQTQYGVAHFDLEGVDGMNFNGYMGQSTLRSLISEDRPGVALVGLGRTSNPDAWVIQDAKLANGQRVWEHMVTQLLDWSRELEILENAGVVMGAAHKDPEGGDSIYSWHLKRVREIIAKLMWLLIPGIGTQGGFVEETVKEAFAGPGSVAINSSSKIIFASSGPDFADASAREAAALMNQIRVAGGVCQSAA